MRLPRYGIVFGHFECWDCGREWKSSEVIVRNWIAEEQVQCCTNNLLVKEMSGFTD